jgi:hypothetical protein
MFQLENGSFCFLNTKLGPHGTESIRLFGWKVFGVLSSKILTTWGNKTGTDIRLKKDFI